MERILRISGVIGVAVLMLSTTACSNLNVGPSSSGVYDNEEFDSELPKSGGVLEDLSLKLPEQYQITYNIQERHGLLRTYTQTMCKTDEGIYLELGDSEIGERYVFERLESGKYLMYQYDVVGERYVTLMLTDTIQEQIDEGTLTLDMVAVDEIVVSGYSARISTYFDFYSDFREYLQYEGDEEINGFACEKYSTSYEDTLGRHSVELWIEPEYGLCIRREYQLEPRVGVSSSKIIECTAFVLQNADLPEYK